MRKQTPFVAVLKHGDRVLFFNQSLASGKRRVKSLSNWSFMVWCFLYIEKSLNILKTISYKINAMFTGYWIAFAPRPNRIGFLFT